jgi:hypothetical protein
MTMTMTTTTTVRTKLILLAAALLAGAGACGSKTDANRRNFTDGMKAYLAARGDLCVGRPAWPVDVGARALAARAQDGLQLPVLENLGLTKSIPDPSGGRRYRLTAKGRERYIDRRTRQPVSPDDEDSPAHADFCVVALRLDRVVAWEVHEAAGAGQSTTAVVTYTYTVEAPPWARDPAFQRAFPAVARVVNGAGSAQLVEGFTLTPTGWVANELLPAGRS